MTPHPRRSVWTGLGDLPTSLLFVFPLFVVYEVMLLFFPLRNGADFFSAALFNLAGGNLDYYLMVQALLACTMVGVLLYWRRVRGFDTEKFLPMVFESIIYALTVGTLIIFVMDEFMGLPLEVPVELLGNTSELGLSSKIIRALGAGVYEELVFRLFICGGLAYSIVRCGGYGWAALAIAIIFSSALFAAVHYLGEWGETWSFGTFIYRFLAGVVFAAIFYFRSFAHAVYSHFFYDLYVMLLR